MEQIIELHQAYILPDMLRVKFDPESTLVSGLLKPYLPFFRIYSEYYQDYYIGDEMLRALRNSNPKLHTFLANLEHKTALYDHFVDSYRAKPTQRLFKYELLLRNMLKAMSPAHPDRAALQATF